jgi:hypothetical protein
MNRAALVIFLVGALGASWAISAHAESDQEESCAGEVAEPKVISVTQIRVVDAQPAPERRGVMTVVVAYPGGRAKCQVDLNFSVLAIQWS